MANRYSVYNKETDMPVAVYATSKECASAMGIRLQSFYKYIWRVREGKHESVKWDIYQDEIDEECV